MFTDPSVSKKVEQGEIENMDHHMIDFLQKCGPPDSRIPLDHSCEKLDGNESCKKKQVDPTDGNFRRIHPFLTLGFLYV